MPESFLLSDMPLVSPLIAPLIAALPILWLLVGLGVMKMAAHSACCVGLVLTMALAHLVWGMDTRHIDSALAEGALFALLPILWVILAAFFTYNLSLHTGAIERIKTLLSGISEDRRIQALLIAWGFGSFMEGVAGFGTAVAVPAALLIALGFKPFLAALVCLLANTIAVAFGVVGIPVTTLGQVTGLPMAELSTAVVVQLTPFVFVVPAVIVLAVTRSLRATRAVWLPVLAAGGAFALVQFLAARYIGPELPAILGALASSAAVVLCAKCLPLAAPWRFPDEAATAGSADAAQPGPAALNLKSQLAAWSPYLILLVIVLGASRLVPPLHQALGQVTSTLTVYTGPPTAGGGGTLVFSWLLTPGTMVLAAALLGGLLQGARPAALGRVFVLTAWQLRKTAVTVICIVAMAKVLSYSGMVFSIAEGLAFLTGASYPLFSPLLGALGTFITGSDTSANILFGPLQCRMAAELSLSPLWLAAANTSGACIGKLISPQSIAIATMAAGLEGQEGGLLSAALRYALAFLAALGVLVLVFS